MAIDRRLAKATRLLERIHALMTPPNAYFEPTPTQVADYEALVARLDALSKTIKKVRIK